MTTLLKKLAFVLPSLFALAACGPMDDEARYSQIHSDSGFRGPSYANLLKQLDQLPKGEEQSIQVVHYGKTVEGRDMSLVRISQGDLAKGTQDRPAILITQAIHGDEYLGIADKLVIDFANRKGSFSGLDEFLATGGILYVVPVVNPDGYERHQRANRNGDDLNRDWASDYLKVDGFKNPETDKLAAYLKKDLTASHASLKVSMDYHCCSMSRRDTLLLHPWGTSEDLHDGTIPDKDVEHFENVRDQFQNFFPNFQFGTPYQTVHYTARGSLMDYLYEGYHTWAFSYEGSYTKEHEQYDRHASFWNKIATELQQL